MCQLWLHSTHCVVKVAFCKQLKDCINSFNLMSMWGHSPPFSPFIIIIIISYSPCLSWMVVIIKKSERKRKWFAILNEIGFITFVCNPDPTRSRVSSQFSFNRAHSRCCICDWWFTTRDGSFRFKAVQFLSFVQNEAQAHWNKDTRDKL